MTGIRLAQLACKQCRTFVVWAMVPLAVFNGHTVVGCGCSGHFKSACQCPPSLLGEERTKVNPAATCPMCSGHAMKNSSCRCDSARHLTTGPKGLQRHPCFSIAIYDFVPGIGNSQAAGDQQQVRAVLSAPLELPVLTQRPHVADVLIEPGQPDDLVVLLRRLLI